MNKRIDYIAIEVERIYRGYSIGKSAKGTFRVFNAHGIPCYFMSSASAESFIDWQLAPLAPEKGAYHA